MTGEPAGDYEENVVPLRGRNLEGVPLAPALQSAGGGGTYDGMDGWQTSVENRLQSIDGRVLAVDDKLDRRFDRLDDKIDSHFHIVWGAMIFGFIGVAGLLARGFGWL